MRRSVLIVEDNPVLAGAFATAVGSAPDFQVAGIARDYAQGIALLESTSPSVVLVDLELPGGSGVDIIRRASRLAAACESLVVTVFADDESIMRCIRAGASGYLLKDGSDVDIVRQLRLVCDGGSPITPRIARRLLLRLGGGPARAGDEGAGRVDLSHQERSVLNLSAKGFSYEETAAVLSITRHTVETYVKRIYRKLQVHSKTEAVYEARKLGLVDD